MKRLSFLVACAACGLVWGALAALSARHLELFDASLQIIVFSTAVGILIGYLSKWIYVRDTWWLIPWSLATLYVGVALLACLGGLYRIAFPVVPVQPPMGPIDVVVYGTATTIWGFTKGLYFLFFWPLSTLNHIVLRRIYLRLFSPLMTSPNEQHIDQLMVAIDRTKV
jgi:hypothetical protein